MHLLQGGRGQVLLFFGGKSGVQLFGREAQGREHAVQHLQVAVRDHVRSERRDSPGAGGRRRYSGIVRLREDRRPRAEGSAGIRRRPWSGEARGRAHDHRVEEEREGASQVRAHGGGRFGGGDQAHHVGRHGAGRAEQICERSGGGVQEGASQRLRGQDAERPGICGESQHRGGEFAEAVVGYERQQDPDAQPHLVHGGQPRAGSLRPAQNPRLHQVRAAGLRREARLAKLQGHHHLPQEGEGRRRRRVVHGVLQRGRSVQEHVQGHADGRWQLALRQVPADEPDLRPTVHLLGNGRGRYVHVVGFGVQRAGGGAVRWRQGGRAVFVALRRCVGEGYLRLHVHEGDVHGLDSQVQGEAGIGGRRAEAQDVCRGVESDGLRGGKP
mmetsp:Transcript_952/g.2276  ORF Transcript_952/g.2276 Transcript_952/m.2276 type:complete len:384 (+) Transcript_952:958-2109(+)